ncbi:NAD(P)/FAD-dependent oxidoreductase [Candidatus Woesearchaeota archaeon]|nr:NAD(P)/FAD-dependent oxidoreductase [Candidatus Woesearchaeota archaeon]
MSKVTIIGAGPAGNYTAYLLAKSGNDVSVYEEHSTIGEPWACTGVITEDVMARNVKLPEDVIVNRIRKARITAPDGNSVEVSLKNNIVVDRAKLDQHLAEMAKKEGAKYYVSHRFMAIEGNADRVTARIRNKNINKETSEESDWLIGCDGPRSETAKQAGIFGDRKFYVGLQATAKIENDNIIDFYPSEKGIAWKVPENSKTVRAGIAAEQNARSYFNEFMTTTLGKDYEQKIIGHQAGPIPLYNPKLKTQKGIVLLVGDAATMVKAPTLGGINQSIIAATAAAEAKTLEREAWQGLMAIPYDEKNNEQIHRQRLQQTRQHIRQRKKQENT